MANYEATRYDFDGANLTGIEGIPTATIIPWSDSAVPSGFLECDGAAVSRSTYSALFSIIGTTYGSGDGSTTFNVPDLQDNVPVGKSGTKAVGSTGGSNNTSINGNVATNTNVTGNVATNVSSNASGGTANASLSTAQLASHSHGIKGGEYTQNPRQTLARTDQYNSSFGSNVNTNNAGSGGGHSHNLSVNVSSNASSNLSANASSSSNFTGDAASTLQPYLTVIYIIKT
jgi:microcystin-dependent protein